MNLIFGEIQGSQNWQRVQAFDLGELVRAQEHFFDPQIWEVFNPLNLVAIKGEHSQILVGLKAMNNGNIIVIQVQIFEVLVCVGVLDAHDFVAGVVDPFKVGRRCEIKGEFQLVVRRVKFDQVLDGTKRFEAGKIVARDINILQVFVLLDSIHGSKTLFGDG